MIADVIRLNEGHASMDPKPSRFMNRLFLCGMGACLCGMGALAILAFLIVLLDLFQLFPIRVDLNGQSHKFALLKSALIGVITIPIGIVLIKTGRKLPKIPMGGQGG